MPAPFVIAGWFVELGGQFIPARFESKLVDIDFSIDHITEFIDLYFDVPPLCEVVWPCTTQFR
jgi:hypothetical protein